MFRPKTSRWLPLVALMLLLNVQASFADPSVTISLGADGSTSLWGSCDFNNDGFSDAWVEGWHDPANDNPVTPEVTYPYAATACWSVDYITYYNGVTGTITPLAGPTDLTHTTANETEANLCWKDNSSHEEGYIIERSTDGTTFNVLSSSLPANTTSFQDSGLSAYTTYYYRVRAYSGTNVFSDYSLVAQIKTDPHSPTNLYAESKSQTQITLAWQDHASSETAYFVGRSTDGITYSTIVQLAANAVTYVDTTVDYNQNQNYYYRVWARYANSYETGFSNILHSPLPELPADPSNLSLVANSSNQITLNWADGSNNETGFRIERRTGGGTWCEVTKLPPDSHAFIDHTGLYGGTTYEYRVFAYCDWLDSDPISASATTFTGSGVIECP